MRILIVFTGGTIGSTLHNDIISTDKDKSHKLLDAYEKNFGLDFEYISLEPYTELSENNTGEHIKKLTDCVLKNTNCGYDGIVITHGTDTLQYTAAAISYAVGSESIPICIVSANRPVEHSESNALFNLHSAITFIKNSYGKGVFVPYKNDGEEITKIHRATRLLPSRPFSDEVSSIFNCEYGYFDESFEFSKNPLFKESEDTIFPLNVSNISDMSSKILFVNPYVGMNYPSLDENVKFVLLSSFHSGTINTKSNGAKIFFNKAKSLGIKVYLTGATDTPEYESSTVFDELCITPIKNISPIAAYIKLWILSSNKEDPTNLLSCSLSGDISI